MQLYFEVIKLQPRGEKREMMNISILMSVIWCIVGSAHQLTHILNALYTVLKPESKSAIRGNHDFLVPIS